MISRPVSAQQPSIGGREDGRRESIEQQTTQQEAGEDLWGRPASEGDRMRKENWTLAWTWNRQPSQLSSVQPLQGGNPVSSLLSLVDVALAAWLTSIWVPCSVHCAKANKVAPLQCVPLLRSRAHCEPPMTVVNLPKLPGNSVDAVNRDQVPKWLTAIVHGGLRCTVGWTLNRICALQILKSGLLKSNLAGPSRVSFFSSTSRRSKSLQLETLKHP